MSTPRWFAAVKSIRSPNRSLTWRLFTARPFDRGWMQSNVKLPTWIKTNKITGVGIKFPQTRHVDRSHMRKKTSCVYAKALYLEGNRANGGHGFQGWCTYDGTVLCSRLRRSRKRKHIRVCTQVSLRLFFLAYFAGLMFVYFIRFLRVYKYIYTYNVVFFINLRLTERETSLQLY